MGTSENLPADFDNDWVFNDNWIEEGKKWPATATCRVPKRPDAATRPLRSGKKQESSSSSFEEEIEFVEA